MKQEPWEELAEPVYWDGMESWLEDCGGIYE